MLIPLDGSTFAEQALPITAEIANRCGARLELIRIVDDEPHDQEVDDVAANGERPIYQVVDLWRDDAQRYIHQIGERISHLTPAVTGIVRVGNPAVLSALLAVGPRALVILNTQGNRGAQRWVFGEVAEKIRTSAVAPTLVLRSDIVGPQLLLRPQPPWNGTLLSRWFAYTASTQTNVARRIAMKTPASRTFIVACNAFIRQMVLHHERGDYYPRAIQVAAELGFPPDQTAAVLGAMRGYGWITPGPYELKETRITARGWDCLEHHRAAPERAAPLDLQMIGKHASEKAPTSMGVSRLPVSTYAAPKEQCPKRGR